MLLAAAGAGGVRAKPMSGQIEPGRFLVYFNTGEATLDAGAAQVIATAAQQYQETGAAQIEVMGHTDTVGSRGVKS